MDPTIQQGARPSEQPELLTAKQLVRALSYATTLHPNAREWMEHCLARVLKLDDLGLDLFEAKHRLLERYERLPEALLQSARHQVTYQDIYDNVIGQWSSAVSYMTIYSRLEERGELSLERVERLLDLGSGYWIASAAFEVGLPNLRRAIGVEWNGSKVMAYDSNTQPLLGVSKSKFKAVAGDFFKLKETDSNLSESVRREGPFDLAIMQNYFPEGGALSPAKSYPALFRSLAELLTPQGKLVLMVDKRDYHNSQILAELRPMLASGFRHYDDTRITPSGHFGMISPMDVDLFVGDKKSLAASMK
ncbi:MAG: hypothetical protein J5J00_11960 [Deltaproteobacteria bacterium]|nr:hypothetical protein [Deltaproteobacteria bacterium]